MSAPPDSSSTQILCILDEFSSQFVFIAIFVLIVVVAAAAKILFFNVIFMQLDEKFQHQHQVWQNVNGSPASSGRHFVARR